MQIFKETVNRKILSVLKEMPMAIVYKPGAPATHYFNDETEYKSTCLNCANPYCMYFEESDIECSEVKNFPYDRTLSACPVDAIAWNADTDSPIINTKKCVYCGICMRRCPAGAIYYDEEIKVNTAPTDNTTKVKASIHSLQIQKEQLETLINKPRGGVLIKESDELFEKIYAKLFNIKNVYHNPIGRNLLISLGCKSAMRRIGDVYTRMDAVYSSSDNSFGAVEIEFGRDTLDAARGILDDIAVLHTRYDINKDDNQSLVICLQLPNARQGYWQVIKDVKTVEDIYISTITIGAMMILNWNGCSLIPDDVTYYIDYDNMSLRQTIEWQLDRKADLSDKTLGILEPIK
jgi:NAD-dependent dihydropyrimidine dehydrogenase PreA subunit